MTTEYLLTEIEQLKLERDEFKAKLHTLQVEILDMSCAKANNSGFEPSLSVYQRSIDIVIAEARKTPTQHLTDIKADAVISLIDSDLGHSVESGCFSSGWVYTADEVKDHANKLREGK